MDQLNVTARNGDYIQTYTGLKFYPLDPRPEEVRIEDIAHALSQQTRFVGHLKRFYSIAEHSVHVSYLCKPENAMAGLMHDATEAYLIDVARPVKRDPRLAFYSIAENALMDVISERFGLPKPMMNDDIKWADNIIIGAEAITLMNQPPVDGWHLKYGAPDEFPVHMIKAWTPRKAKAAFMRRYEELTRNQLQAAA